MARKVFISFLGTNNYLECKYEFNGVISKPVRFVQEALIEHVCKDWIENDKILIFCTTKNETDNGSKESNWLDNGQANAKSDIEKIGLEHRLNDLKERVGLKASIEEVDIVAGFTEDEIWKIFDTVYGKLCESDLIYFDVTHAFRSIPLFSVVLFNYSKFMLDTQVMSVLYGAFERLGPGYKVAEIPLENRVAKVVDLTNIIRLQEYNQIASDLKKYGKIKEISNIINECHSNETASVISDFCNAIDELDNYINTIDINKIREGKFVQKFLCNYKPLKRKGRVPKPIQHLLDKLKKEISAFKSEKSFDNLESAVRWTIKYNMLMQVYPLTQEYVIMRVSDYFQELRPKEMDKKVFRSFVSDILGMPNEDFENRKWKWRVAEYPQMAEIIADDSNVILLRPLYEPIRKIRNSLAHGNGSFQYDELQELIPQVEECLDYVKNMPPIKTDISNDSILSIPKIKPSIFLNLSNHPSASWEKAQIDAALKYGTIEDMPFPAISPDADEKSLEKLVDDTVNEILKITETAHVTVHVMGEMTFTCALVTRLVAEGIVCVASTTERVAEEHGDEKKSIFKFVKFRQYKL